VPSTLRSLRWVETACNQRKTAVKNLAAEM
jgi:hypothetical protein